MHMSSPFDAPADGVKITDYVGRLLIMVPTEIREKFSTAIGEADPVVANVIVVDEKNPLESTEHNGTLIFQKVLCAQLRPNVGTGRPILGRLSTRKSTTKGKNDAYVFDAASPDEIKVAAVYWESRASNPFAAPKGD